MTLRLGLVTMLALATPLAAAESALPQPEQFAWQWHLPIPPGQPMARFTLSEAHYARLLRDDLSDLAAFNAQDDSLPLGPASQLPGAWPVATSPPLLVLPALRLPRDGGEGIDRAQLEVALSAARRGLRIDIDPAGQPAAPAADWLVLLDGLEHGARALHVELMPQAVDALHARVEIAGSDDLSDWRALGPPQTLLSLRQDDLQLQRLGLDLPPGWQPRYLRLRRLDGAQGLPIQTLRAEPRARIDAPGLQRISLQGTPVAGTPGAFDYQLPGPIPVERAALQLADGNSVARLSLLSRANADSGWRERLNTVAFRLDDADGTVAAPAQSLARQRDRHWRVLSAPALAKPPRLQLDYRPDAFVVLAQGDPPYRLAAGSARARRPDYPLAAAFAELRSRHGEHWLPPDIQPDQGQALSGDDALRPPAEPLPWRRGLLWALLIAGSLAVAGLALSLLRKAPDGR